MYFNDIDFIKLYNLHHKKTLFEPISKEEWDIRVNGFKNFKDAKYYEELISKIDLSNVDSILDVGCGNGNLAVKFLEIGKKVVGIDYSDGMIDAFKANTRGYSNVKVVKKAWEDEWDDIESCDIAIVSKSFEFSKNCDVKEIISKLNSHAKKGVYITYYVGNYLDNEIIEWIGRKIVDRPDYILLLNMLYQLGIYAKVDFIIGDYNDSIQFFDDFLQIVKWKIGKISDVEIKKLKKYYALKKEKKELLFKKPRWALISWEK